MVLDEKREKYSKYIMKDLLNINNLNLIDECIDKYHIIVNQENIVKLEYQILTSRYFWLLDVRRYIQIKISIERNASWKTSPDTKLNIVL